MANVNLILSLPYGGMITATSLGVSGYAWHRSPGTNRKFQGRSILVDLALSDGYPAFEFMDEGGWRDAGNDTRAALDSIRKGKRTKTSLSNSAFNCTPLSAYSHVYLAKSSGDLFEMQPSEKIHEFTSHTCAENLSPDQIAQAAGLSPTADRRPRIFLVVAPIEMMVFSNLTPLEYIWYATNRTGKVFRQVLFTELNQHCDDHIGDLAAQEIFETAIKELTEKPEKKTKTVTVGGCFSRIPYFGWKGFREEVEGGLYGGDRNGAWLWRFPKQVPHIWERAS